MITANCYLIIYFFLLLYIRTSSKEIQLSPHTFWNQTGITVTGSANGIYGSSFDELYHPLQLSITTNDVLYVSDKFNQRVVVVHLTNYKNRFIIGPILNTNTTSFGDTYGLFTTDTSLYVIELKNHKVQKLSLNGTNATIGCDLSGFDWPHYLYVDNDGHIYVSDTHKHEVLRFDSISMNFTRVAGTGVNGSDNNTLDKPYGVFVTADKSIYVADYQNHRIMKWLLNASSGIRVAGDGTPGSSATQLNRPSAVVVDRNTYMYICDTGNHRIVRWAPNSNFGVCIVACTASYGTLPTQLNAPHSLGFDSNGSLYVCEYNNNRVQKFQILNYHVALYGRIKLPACATWESSATTAVKISFADSTHVGMFADTNQTEIVVQNGNDTKPNNFSGGLYRPFVTSNGIVYTNNGILNRGSLKWPLNTAFHGFVRSHLHSCTSLFIDINDSIYCSYAQEHIVIKVQFIGTSNQNITTTFGNGKQGSTLDSLSSPSGIFVDSYLNLHVADTGNDRIVRFKRGCTDEITVTGNPALGNRGLKSPTAVVVDSDNYLYIADCGNHRIIRSEANGFRCVVGCSVDDNLGFSQYFNPQVFWFDTAGDIFVFNQNKNSVLKFSLLKKDPRAYSSCMRPLICWNPKRIGLYCNFSIELCDIFQPCQNNGTCRNSDDNQNYSCDCVADFSGTRCELDHRVCKPDTCWNHGSCNKISETEFNCTCAPGWEGRQCERRINFCTEIQCENRGVCRSLLFKPICECLSGYSGDFCQTTEMKLAIYKTVSKTFAFVAIIALIFVAAFVIIMDVLKYCFGIDPVKEERERMQRERQAKNRRPVIQRFTYVPAPADPSTPKRRLPIIEETIIE